MKLAWWFWFPVFLFLIFTHCNAEVFVQNFVIAQVKNNLSNDEKDNENNKATLIPVPASLRSDWWQFFNVVDPQFKIRVDQFTISLHKLIEKLPAPEQLNGQKLTNRILANLAAIAKLQRQSDLTPNIDYIVKDKYNIEQWLELQRLHRDKLQETLDKQITISHLSEAIDAANKHYNKAMAAYISIDQAKQNKIFIGLNLIANRSGIELAELRVERHKKEHSNLLKAQEALSKTIAVATGLLIAPDNELVSLNNQKQKYIASLNDNEIMLDKLHSQLINSMTETPMALAQNMKLEQQLIHASVDKSIVFLNLLITEGKLDFIQLLINNTVKSEAFHNKLNTRQALIEETSNQLGLWRTETLREQTRVQNLLLNQPSQDPELQKIHDQRNKLTQETLFKILESNNLLLDLELLNNLYKSLLIKQEGIVKHGWYSTLEVIKSIWETAVSSLTASLFNIGETPVTLLGLIRVILILMIAWLISCMIRRMLTKITERSEGDGSALYTVGRLAHYVILLVGMVIALSSIGLDFTNLALVAGALSVGIGFGLQSIVNNFVSGLILLFERSLKVGDFIELDSGVQGAVMEINVRSTLINTNDNVDIIVPNGELVSAKVTNWTLRDAIRRMRIPFGVAYGTEKELVKKAVLEAAKKVTVTLMKPKHYEPQIWLVGFGDSSLNFELVVWVSQAAVKRPGWVTAAYLWEIETLLKQYDIEIPFPQRDLHLRSLFDKRGEEAAILLRKGEPCDRTQL